VRNVGANGESDVKRSHGCVAHTRDLPAWSGYTDRSGSRPNESVAVLATTTHPDATAFTARFLARPDDRLGRLVFADWLDEQGGEANTAWARYLRYMAYGGEVLVDIPDPRADAIALEIRARLTLSRLPGNSLLPWLTAFLPEHRIRVLIGTGKIAAAITRNLPESMALEHCVIQIGAVGQVAYFVLAPGAEKVEHVRKRLSYVLNRDVVLLRGEPSDVRNATNAHYGWSAIDVERLESSA
jgi:uncharacterized protein (TIGR02996 family)